MRTSGRGPHARRAPLLFRTVYEDSGPGRPLSCFMEEPAPYTDSTGAAAGGGDCRFVESPSQDQRLQAQRLRNPEVRGSLQTPQNRPHGHQSPELPEGYGERIGPAVPRGGCRGSLLKPFVVTVRALSADVGGAVPYAGCVRMQTSKEGGDKSWICQQLLHSPSLAVV